jgi:hypothetical protein
MARDEDMARCKVKASVILVIRRIFEKDTKGRPGNQLMVSGGGGVRVTCTPEDSKVVVPRRGTEESMVRCVSWAGSRSKTVKEIGGGVQTLSLEASG